MKISYCSCLIAICLAANLYVSAQDTLINVDFHGRLDSLHSTILNQERPFQVFLPPGYKPGSGEKYDVLYVTDGSDYNINLINYLQRFVEWHEYMPPTIIVSVIQLDRNVDLTPTHLDGLPGSGGAAKFLGFIKNELIPYINESYPSNYDNTLWGHSLGGMFVLYTLLNEPTLFKSYIMSDPGVWWDNNYVIKMAAEKLPSLPLQHTTLFVSGRDVDMSAMHIDTLETVLKKDAPIGLNWKLVVYNDETHSAVRLKDTYDALKFTYAGMIRHMDFHPNGGIVSKDKPFKLYYDVDTNRVHYTLDGTEPTINSPKAQTAVLVNGPATVTFKVFTNRTRYDNSTQGVFRNEEMPKPLLSAKNWMHGGLNYAYYEGDWDNMPDFKSLTPVKTGVADSAFDAGGLPRRNHYALVIDGLLEAKEDGYYVFFYAADNGSKLYVDGKPIITWHGDPGQAITGIVPLSKGFYPFRMEYLCQREDSKFGFAYLTPSIMESQDIIPIPASLEYYKKQEH